MGYSTHFPHGMILLGIFVTLLQLVGSNTSVSVGAFDFFGCNQIGLGRLDLISKERMKS
jgi:hypothetical protein